MKYILEMLEKLSLLEKENADDPASGEDILNNVVRSVKRSLSLSENTTLPTRKSRKEALYKLYSNSGSFDREPLSKGRRHSTSRIARLETSGSRETTKHREGVSFFDIAKDKLLSRSNDSKDLIAESVARKLEARHKAMKDLTRAETVSFIRTKYNICKKIS